MPPSKQPDTAQSNNQEQSKLLFCDDGWAGKERHGPQTTKEDMHIVVYIAELYYCMRITSGQLTLNSSTSSYDSGVTLRPNSHKIVILNKPFKLRASALQVSQSQKIREV